MNSKAPDEALFKGSITVDSVGGYPAYGRLVACAALEGKSIEQTAEMAATRELAAQLGLTYPDASALLRGLKKRSESSK